MTRGMLRAALGSLMVTAGVFGQSGYAVRMNPGASVDGAAALTPVVLTTPESFAFAFGAGDPPASVVVDWGFEYTNEEEVALIERFTASPGPVVTAADLGLGDITNDAGLQAMFNAYFAAHPDVEWAFGWYTGGAGDVSLSGAVQAEAITLGPMGQCSTAGSLVVDQTIAGGPHLSDGVAGFHLLGVVTKNEITLYVEKGGERLTSVGHTFVSLKASGKEPKFYGFYPGNAIAVVGTVPGALHDDEDHDWTHRVRWQVPTKEFNAAAKFVAAKKANVRMYRLLDVALGGSENCTSWALGVVNAAGLPLRSAKNWIFVYDPKPLNATLAPLAGMLFMNCGKVTANGGAAQAGGDDPFDYSPEGTLQGAISEPATIAGELGLPLLEGSLGTSGIVPGAALTLAMSGVDPDGVVWAADWGDGGEPEVGFGLFASHVYASPGAFSARVAVFEDGSLQHFTIGVQVDGGQAGDGEVEVALADLPALVVENGPFIETADPDVVDVTSCATDCNENSIPDCEEGAFPFTLDCNGNGVLDACDIAEGVSLDGDADGVPDECAPAVAGDLDGDGDVDSTDLNILLAAFGCVGPAECAGDADGDGDTDSADLNVVLGNFGVGV